MTRPTLDEGAIRSLVAGAHGDPFAVLGPHRVDAGGRPALAIRAFVPGATAARVVAPGVLPAPREMARLHPEGLFDAVVPERAEPFPYRLEVADGGGAATVLEDPYRFAPTLGDFDRHLLAEGTHYEAHEKLGAHRRHALEGRSLALFRMRALRDRAP